MTSRGDRAFSRLPWALATRLRDEVYLDALSNELVGVVRETVRPAHASLWLRR